AVLERDGRTTVQNISAIMPVGRMWDPEDTKRGPVGGPEELIEGEVVSEVTEHLLRKPTAAELDDDRIRKQLHVEMGAQKRKAEEEKRLAEEKKDGTKEETKEK